MKDFLPITIEEIQQRGWEQIDFLFVSGDAYVDHPSFGPAVICPAMLMLTTLPSDRRLSAMCLKRRVIRLRFCASRTGAGRKILPFWASRV